VNTAVSNQKRYFPRILEQRLRSLWKHFPTVAVLGARQVGKSTLVGHLFDDMRTFVFDPVQDVGNARADPDMFLQNNPPPLFLDEVQYAPGLLAAIKRRVDRSGAAGQYMLSGSQNLMVLRSVSESLAGRVAILDLAPMSYAEQQERTHEGDSLHQWLHEGSLPTLGGSAPPWWTAIWRGGYPGLIGLPDELVQPYFESYVRTYIERDIRTVAAVHDLQLFSRFFGLLAGHTSCEVNASELGRALGIDRKTAGNWLSVAEATYQWIEIPAFGRNPAKRVTGKQKGYATDTGLVCYHQRIPESDFIPSHPLHGRLVETWVVNEIMKRTRTWSTCPSFWHYRAHTGAEVDLILDWGGRLFPIEIKVKSHPARSDARGMAAFRKAHPRLDIAPGLLVCAIETPAKLADDLFALPWWML